MAWQEPFTLIIVAAAAGYLLRQSWRALAHREGGGCATGCSKCPSQTAPGDQPLVSVDSLLTSSKRPTSPP